MCDLALINAEAELIKNTILAINFYRRLRYIAENETIDNMSYFQKLSAKCVRTFLLQYLNFDFFEKYEIIRSSLRNTFMLLYEQTEYLEETAPELCVYCDDFIESSTLTCKDNHANRRCCISMVQVILIACSI